jgi:hypothetical protein
MCRRRRLRDSRICGQQHERAERHGVRSQDAHLAAVHDRQHLAGCRSLRREKRAASCEGEIEPVDNLQRGRFSARGAGAISSSMRSSRSGESTPTDS